MQPFREAMSLGQLAAYGKAADSSEKILKDEKGLAAKPEALIIKSLFTSFPLGNASWQGRNVNSIATFLLLFKHYFKLHTLKKE